MRSAAVLRQLGRHELRRQGAAGGRALARPLSSAGGGVPTGGKALDRRSTMGGARRQAQYKRTAEDAVNTILYEDTPKGESKRHILSVLVDNTAGVLSKVSGLLSSRGANIDSLSVSATDVADLSRMTIVLDCPDSQLEQARRQLEDLVDVWAVMDLGQVPHLERELLIVKVDCLPPHHRAEMGDDAEDLEADEDEDEAATRARTYEDDMARHFHRHSIVEIAKMFEGKVTDVGTEHMVLEVVASPMRIDAFLTLLSPFGIVEAVRSGVIAMQRSKIDTFHQVRVSAVGLSLFFGSLLIGAGAHCQS